jgi:hypothetical protein
VNAVYQGQFVLTHYLSRTFKQLWRSINKWWATARKTVTNMLVKRCLPRPRVVAKGYLQKRTSDFSSFSPTASQVTLRVILALTAMVGFKSWDLDDTCAFYNAPLPKGQKFFLLCSKVYTKVGYTQLKSDECVFVRQEDNVRKRIEICKDQKADCLSNRNVSYTRRRQSVQGLHS